MSSVPANPTLMLDVVWKGKADDASSGCLSDGVVPAALPPDDELDRPSGWARVGTRWAKRLVRLVEEGSLSGAGAVEGSLRAEANQGFVGGSDEEAAGSGADAVVAWWWVVLELCSRDN
jgi:hypothetical protein